MELKDYPVREAMRLVDTYLCDAKVDIVSFLSMDLLMQAGEDEELRDWISSVDLIVPISTEILKVAGIGGRSRLAEVEEGRFRKELLKRLSDDNRTAFLLVQKEEETEFLAQYLEKAAPKISIVGSYAFENLNGDPDEIVNEINSTFPDVVFSLLSSPDRECFARDHKAKLNAKLWIVLWQELLAHDPKPDSKIKKIRQQIRSKLFFRSMTRYTNEQENKGEDL